MINSRHEWNIDYLRELREKFLEQDYPLRMINKEYSKALQISRKVYFLIKIERRKEQLLPP
jgi:hypothetical protein